MAIQSYTKESIASSQIDTAIRLYEEGNFLGALTLAGAAEEILGKLVSESGRQSALASLKEAVAAIHTHLSDEEIAPNWVVTRANSARNSLKHLDTSAGRDVSFDPEDEATDMLNRAIINCWRANGVLTPAMQRFEHSQRAV